MSLSHSAEFLLLSIDTGEEGGLVKHHPRVLKAALKAAARLDGRRGTALAAKLRARRELAAAGLIEPGGPLRVKRFDELGERLAAYRTAIASGSLSARQSEMLALLLEAGVLREQLTPAERELAIGRLRNQGRHVAEPERVKPHVPTGEPGVIIDTSGSWGGGSW